MPITTTASSASRIAFSSALTSASTRRIRVCARPISRAFTSSRISHYADVSAPPPPPPNADSGSGSAKSKPKSPHGMLYGTTFPAMIPIFLLGSAVYLGLHLAQMTLAHEKEMDAAKERVRVLEAEIDALQAQRVASPSSSPSSASSSSSPSSSSISSPVSTEGLGASFQDARLHQAAAGAGKAASWWKWW